MSKIYDDERWHYKVHALLAAAWWLVLAALYLLWLLGEIRWQVPLGWLGFMLFYGFLREVQEKRDD